MSGPTLGVDCHVILSHPDIDLGVGYGFISPQDGSVKDEGVQITRRTQSQDTTFADAHADSELWFSFDVICADNLRDPNGQKHAKTRSQDYSKLCEYMLKTEGLVLTTPIGAFSALGALGYTADERHYPKYSIIKCQLNNVGYYFPPVDADLLAMSLWSRDGSLSLTWDTGYWR